MVSDLLEKNASDVDRTNKIDLADWLIKQLSVETEMSDTVMIVDTEFTETEKMLRYMTEVNPSLQILIDTCDLKLIV